MEEVLIIEDGLILRAELNPVRSPDGCVVLVKEALVWPVGAVVRTLTPLVSRGVRRSARGQCDVEGGSEGKHLFKESENLVNKEVS